MSVFLPWGIVRDPRGTTILQGFDITNDGIIALALGVTTIGFGVAATRLAATVWFVRRALLALGVSAVWLRSRRSGT